MTTFNPFASVVLSIAICSCFTLVPRCFHFRFLVHSHFFQLRLHLRGILRQNHRGQTVHGLIGLPEFRRQIFHSLRMRCHHTIVSSRKRTSPRRARAQPFKVFQHLPCQRQKRAHCFTSFHSGRRHQPRGRFHQSKDIPRSQGSRGVIKRLLRTLNVHGNGAECA